MKTKTIIVTLLSIILVDMVGLYLYYYHFLTTNYHFVMTVHRFGQDGIMKNLRWVWIMDYMSPNNSK